MSVSRKFVASLTLALSTSLMGLAGTPALRADDTITLRAITPYPIENYLAHPLQLYADILAEKTNGRLKIRYLGNAEVVPVLEQFDAVRNGTVDIALNVASYYTGSVPEAIGIQYNRKKRPSDLRENGFYDLMRKLHLEKGGVIYLANASGTPGEAFRLYTVKKIDDLDGFKGLKFRVSPVYTALVNALGATPVSMPPSDTYSALERGIVDGLGWTYAGTIDYGFPEVAKYVINHPFYSLNSTILMNKDVYDELPDDLRAQVEEASVEFEKQVVDYYANYIAEEDKRLEAAGVEFITLPDGQGQKYEDLAYDAGWALFLTDNPEDGEAIKAMLE